MKKLVFVLLFISIFVVGCMGPEERLAQQIDSALSEEFDYLEFEENGFSVLYPNWPTTDQGDNSVEVSVSRGYCSVAVNVEKMSAKQWYQLMEDSIDQEKIISADGEGKRLKYSSKYQNITLISDNKIVDCNDQAIAVTMSCIKQVDEEVSEMREKIFGSIGCEKEDVEYAVYEDEDFSIKHPGWGELEDEEETRILGVSKGTCSIIVDKHNALPKDIINWLESAMEEQADHEWLSSSKEGETYSIDYERLYEESKLNVEGKVVYCNYQSYITQVLCVEDYLDEELRTVKEEVLESAKCAREYEVPRLELIEEEKEELRLEEPEVIEEIEDEIVQTNVGAEFGIDEEMVVYFINGNEFFSRIMKDFPLANLVIEDTGRELKLKVTIDGNGKIILLENGEHADEDVTLLIPLRDALNIFSNAQNINPVTLLSFAANVRTEPVEIKNEVIQKVLMGEYG